MKWKREGEKMGNHQYLCTITTINANTPLQYTTSVYPTQIVQLTWQASNPCCPSSFRKSAHPPWHTPRLKYSEYESSESQMQQERVSSITQTFRASSLFRSSSATFSLASLASFLHDVSQLQQQGNHHSAHTHSRKLQAGYTANTHTCLLYTNSSLLDPLQYCTHTRVYFAPILLC